MSAVGRATSRVLGMGPARLILILIGIYVLLMVFWPSALAHYSPGQIDSAAILRPPSLAHPLGTDEAGADVWTRIVYATRLELTIAVGSALIALVIGIPTGLLAGYAGRIVDGALSSVTSATLAFPLILFAILIVASFGTTTVTLVGVIGFLFFPAVFLLVRGQTLSLKEREFVVAVRVTGIGSAKILVRHILPNLLGPLLTLIPQLMAETILVEAGLSYLGLGVQLPQATWGTILQTSKDYYVTAPTYALAAGLVITIASALLMFAGELISESLNPMRRRRGLS
jgi:peptide/nickel transport system permease protein